jgi:transcriptional regulator with XRE-family HTH domain
MMEPETRSGLPYSTDHLAEGLKKAREFRGISTKDCSRLLGIPANKLQNYEKAKYVPSLSELESLSYIYSVPLAALFYPEEYPDIFKVPDAEQLKQLLQIRMRIISTTLQIAFERTDKSLKEISKTAGVPVSKFKRYLGGVSDIPFGDLQRLTSALDLDINTLMDSESPIGQWQELQKKKIAFVQLPENARAFLTKKENWPYMEVVEKMKFIETGRLESIAESFRILAELTPADQETRE